MEILRSFYVLRDTEKSLCFEGMSIDYLVSRSIDADMNLASDDPDKRRSAAGYLFTKGGTSFLGFIGDRCFPIVIPNSP